MTWLPVTAAGSTEFERAFNLRPNLYEDYQAFVSLLTSARPIDPVLLELCRVRVADLLGVAAPYGAPMAALSDEKIRAVGAWRTAPQFSACERACLAFTDKFVLDPHGVTDGDAAAVAEHLSAAEMVAFTEALAIFDGFTRFRIVLGIGTG